MSEDNNMSMASRLAGNPAYDVMFVVRTFNQILHNNSFQPDYSVKERRGATWNVILNHGGIGPNQGPDQYPPTTAHRTTRKFWQSRGSQLIIRRDMFKAQRANLNRAIASILSQLIARYLAEGQPLHYRGRRVLAVMTQTVHLDKDSFRNPVLVGYYSEFSYGPMIRHNRHQIVKLLIDRSTVDRDSVADTEDGSSLPPEPFLLSIDLCACVYDKMIYDEETNLPMAIQHLPVTYLETSTEEDDPEADQDMVELESSESELSGSDSEDNADIGEGRIDVEKMNKELAEKAKSETLDLLRQELAEFEELEQKFQPKDLVDPDQYPNLDGLGDQYLGLKIIKKNKNVVVEVDPARAELVLSEWTATMLDHYGQEEAEEIVAEHEARLAKRAEKGLKPRQEDAVEPHKGPCYKVTYESMYRETNQVVRKRWVRLKASLRKKLKKKV